MGARTRSLGLSSFLVSTQSVTLLYIQPMNAVCTGPKAESRCTQPMDHLSPGKRSKWLLSQLLLLPPFISLPLMVIVNNAALAADLLTNCQTPCHGLMASGSIIPKLQGKTKVRPTRLMMMLVAFGHAPASPPDFAWPLSHRKANLGIHAASTSSGTTMAATAGGRRAQCRDRVGPTLACPRDRTVAISTDRLDAFFPSLLRQASLPLCFFLCFFPFFVVFFVILKPRPEWGCQPFRNIWPR